MENFRHKYGLKFVECIMIIDISQDKQSVIVSYVNESGSISLKRFNVNDICGGFYIYEPCSPEDPEKVPHLKGYMKDEPVKRVPAKQFNDISLRDFLTNIIPKADQDELFVFRVPTVYTTDIEIDLASDDAEAFPKPELALFPICTIQITAPNLNTIILTKDRHRIKDQNAEELQVQAKILDHFKNVDACKGKEMRIKYIVFDSERELLLYWFKVILESIHFTVWYNSWNFDLPYIENRCKKLGIDPSIGSPTGEYKKNKMYPKHRYTQDFMDLVVKYGWDLKLSSRTLHNVGMRVTNGAAGKVKYEGSFKEMYIGDYTFFQFYGAVDTILLQLAMQSRASYLNTVLTQAYFAKIGAYDAWATTKISAAVIFDDLYEDGYINAYPHIRSGKEAYEGGYVKAPIRKFASLPVCFDFASLYPNLYRSTNISFENFHCVAKSAEDAAAWSKKGYFVSVSGNVYRNDRDYTLRKVQSKLMTKRKGYKALEFDIFQNIETAIENEMKLRGLDVHVQI